MKNLLYLLTVVISFSTITKASELDSLLNVLRQQKAEDTNKIKALLNLVDYYSDNYFDSSLYYIKLTEKLSKKLNTSDFDFKLNAAYAEYYYNINNYQSTISHLQKCKHIAINKNDKYLLSKVMNNLSATYSRFGQHRLSIEYALQALHIAKEINDTVNISNRYATISRIYNDLNEFEKSIEYGKIGVEYGKKHNHINGTIISYNNVAASFSSLFKLDSSRYYQQQALILANKNRNVFYIYSSLVNLSFTDFNSGKFDNIKSYNKQLDSLIEEFNLENDNNILANQSIVKSIEFIAENKLDYAKLELLKGVEYAGKEKNNDALLSVYEMLSKLEYLKHNIANAEYYYFKADSIRKNMSAHELNNFALDLETKYETQKKENEILKQQQQLKKRNNWIAVLLSSIFVLSLLSFLVYRYFKQRNIILENEKTIQQQKIIELENEKQLQATESILKGQEDERSRIAKDLHDGLGGLLSGVKYSLNNMKENVILSSDNALSFERTLDMLDSGIQELRRVAHNMMPENLLKFGLDTALKDYCTSISNTGKLNINYSSFGMENFNAATNISVTIYRIIQELINNTMKHAEATQSIVQIANENNILHITVEDNGKGFDVNNFANFKGAGWTNIQNRTTYLKGKINVDSNEINGTSVTIEIPLV